MVMFKTMGKKFFTYDFLIYKKYPFYKLKSHK